MTAMLSHTKQVFWIFLLLPIAICNAADDNKMTNCDTLVTETRATCMDMIQRGLDVSCNTYLGAIGIAMDQASGNLFDTGDADQSVADSLCSTYVDKLRGDRDEHADSMQAQDQAAPECTTLAERFDTRCMVDLGKEPLPRGCRNVARTFMMNQLSQEQACSIAGGQLQKE